MRVDMYAWYVHVAVNMCVSVCVCVNEYAMYGSKCVHTYCVCVCVKEYAMYVSKCVQMCV